MKQLYRFSAIALSVLTLSLASATAAYGIRGANGVIVITTKRGKAAEKATVNLKASVGINQPIGFPEYLGSADYATLYNEARLNDAKMTGADINSLNLFSQQAIDNFRRAKGDNSDGLGYDWDYYDFAFKPGMQEDVSLSIRGGTDKVRYYVLANYFSQGGNYKYADAGEYDSQTKFTRYNFRSNIDININRYLSTRLDLGARITDRNAPGTTAGRLMTICATQPPYLPILVEENSHPQNEEYIQQNSRGMLYGDNIYRYNILGELSLTDSFIESFPILPYATRQGVRVPGTVVEVVRNIPFHIRTFTLVRDGTVAEVFEEYQRTVRLLGIGIYIRYQSVHFLVTGKHICFRNVVIIIPVEVITARSKRQRQDR
jgi:TonB-dependent SusC/RagA subfamily outer membrane receptor